MESSTGENALYSLELWSKKWINSRLRRARDLIYWPDTYDQSRPHVGICTWYLCYVRQQTSKEAHVVSAIADRPRKKVTTNVSSWTGDVHPEIGVLSTKPHQSWQQPAEVTVEVTVNIATLQTDTVQADTV